MAAMHDPGRRVAHMVIDMAASSAAADDMGVSSADGLVLAGNHALDEHGVRRLLEAADVNTSDLFIPPAILVGWLVGKLEDQGEERAAIFEELRALIDGELFPDVD